jgi:flagellar motor switch protein FliN
MTSVDPSPGVTREVSASPPSGKDRAPLATLDAQEGASDVAGESEKSAEAARLDLVLDVPVRLSVELGRTEIPIRDVVNLGRGSVIELDGSPGAPLDVRVNGVLIGRGEVVVINEERLGLRFVEVVSQAERVKRLR